MKAEINSRYGSSDYFKSASFHLRFPPIGFGGRSLFHWKSSSVQKMLFTTLTFLEFRS